MCGRFTFQPTEAVYERFEISNRLDRLTARYNIAPGQMVTALVFVRSSNAQARGGTSIAKILECAKVDPSSGCQHVVRGETEEEVLTKAAEHAKEHGIREVTPELIERVKANIRDA